MSNAAVTVKNKRFLAGSTRSVGPAFFLPGASRIGFFCLRSKFVRLMNSNRNAKWAVPFGSTAARKGNDPSHS